MNENRMQETIVQNYETVALDEENDALVILDQTCLPNEFRILKLKSQKEIWQAIHLLKVRGAPAIGVAAAIGLYIATKDFNDDSTFFAKLARAKSYLASARPTAVNLFWALNRMEACAKSYADQPLDVIKKAMYDEAVKIRQEDILVCQRIGEHGLGVLKCGQGILTHCNAGQLATVKYGTATAPIYLGQKKGYAFQVFVDETRPLLQGARLTAYELNKAGVDVTLICDNMAATVMQKGMIQTVLVGCDRVAANGDTANKIGTAGVAALANYYGVPFYICAPTSTIDMQTLTGKDIKIEERSAAEVTDMWYTKTMAPAGIKVFNPAFDVTDHQLITGIITEYGIVRAPYKENLQKLFNVKEKV